MWVLFEIKNWGWGQVANWISSLDDLPLRYQYADLFFQNFVDGTRLLSFTIAELTEFMGNEDHATILYWNIDTLKV